MITVDFSNEKPKDDDLIFVVIAARYKSKWIFVRHNKRNTYEIPGGQIENGETFEEAAKRELFEETGATDFLLKPVSYYAVTNENKQTWGYLFFAEVNKLANIPDFEIAERIFSERMPEKLTYPQIQPYLYDYVQKKLKKIK